MTYTYWFIAYCVFNVLAFLFVKHFLLAHHFEFEQRCKDVFQGKKDPWGLTLEQAKRF